MHLPAEKDIEARLYTAVARHRASGATRAYEGQPSLLDQGSGLTWIMANPDSAFAPGDQINLVTRTRTRSSISLLIVDS
jgi:hypothetical protein